MVNILVGSKFHVTCGSYSAQMPLVVAKYPDWQKAVPNDTPITVEIDKASLATALRRASVCINKKSLSIELFADPQSGGLKILSKDTEDNRIEDEVAMQADGLPSEGLHIHLSQSYLQDTVAAVEADTIRLVMRDSLRAVTVVDGKQPGWLGMIMPMRG